MFRPFCFCSISWNCRWLLCSCYKILEQLRVFPSIYVDLRSRVRKLGVIAFSCFLRKLCLMMTRTGALKLHVNATR